MLDWSRLKEDTIKSKTLKNFKKKYEVVGKKLIWVNKHCILKTQFSKIKWNKLEIEN